MLLPDACKNNNAWNDNIEDLSCAALYAFRQKRRSYKCKNIPYSSSWNIVRLIATRYACKSVERVKMSHEFFPRAPDYVNVSIETKPLMMDRICDTNPQNVVLFAPLLVIKCANSLSFISYSNVSTKQYIFYINWQLSMLVSRRWFASERLPMEKITHKHTNGNNMFGARLFIWAIVYHD